jgi:FkbM family methyltransferase
MGMNRVVRAACRRLGIQHVGRRRVRDLVDFIEDRAVSLVIDAGANVGQFGQWLRRNGYRGKILSFEPGKAEFLALSRRAKRDGNWEAFHCGLGARSGTAALHVSRLSVFNSFLELSAAARRHDERMMVDHTEEIVVRTLDEVEIPPSAKVLLKIDTQGYERQVLEGARQSLARMAGILLELPVIRTYEGEWAFHEAIRYMADAGFVPAQMQPVGFHTVDKVAAVEFDCLFRPRSEIDGAESEQVSKPAT